MKSIKEKADEFAITNKNSLGYIMQEHVDGYIAGANYVLEQVDHILMDRDLDCVETCDSLFELIEQLKK